MGRKGRQSEPHRRALSSKTPPPKPRPLGEILVFGPRCEKEKAILARHTQRVRAFIAELRLDVPAVTPQAVSDAVRLARVTPGKFSWHLGRRSGFEESARVVAQVATAAKELARGLRPPPNRGVMPDNESSVADSQAAIAPAQLDALTADAAVKAAIRSYSQKQRIVVAADWNQESVLKLLGYAVGASGETKEQRRRSLEACLVLEDQLLPNDQSDFWGGRGTRRRLRAMKRMLGLFISLAEARTQGSWAEACADWKDDLRWLEQRWG
jgi:hypothetical protein